MLIVHSLIAVFLFASQTEKKYIFLTYKINILIIIIGCGMSFEV